MIGRWSAKTIKAKPMMVATMTVHHRLCRIYNTAIGFFQEGGNDASAMEYKNAKMSRDERIFMDKASIFCFISLAINEDYSL
eukprot:2227097-Ditylum_brightwellii.AAC.1